MATLTTLRCDVCDRDIPERAPFFVVSVRRTSVAATLDICGAPECIARLSEFTRPRDAAQPSEVSR